jgi:hypothetical protein
MPNSREYQALDAMKTRLEGITTANGYETDVQLVQIFDEFPDQVREFPAILFKPLRTERPDNERLQRIDARIDVPLILLLETYEEGTRKLSNFVADVEKRLTSDPSTGALDTTLGGATKDLHVRSDERFQFEDDAGDRRAAALLEVQLVVRYAFGDPFTTA